MKKIALICLTLTCLLMVLGGCSKQANDQAPLKIGVTAGPHEQIVEKVKELAAKDHLNVEVVVFNDYIQPNIQLNEKQLDINSYQHTPYLDKFNEDHQMNLIRIAPTVNFPMGIYSNKIQSLEELKEHDKVALPNDPTNEARALKLFEAAHIITLKDTQNLNITIKDIESNPKNIEFVELDAPMVAHALKDVQVAAINTNYAMQAGINPVKDSIFIEPKNSPWINIIAAREDYKKDKRIDKFIKIYHSEAIKKFIKDTFKGSVVPAF